MKSKSILATAVACLCASSLQSAAADDLIYEWYTVANNGDVMPTDSSSDCGSCHEGHGEQQRPGVGRVHEVFNSYNQPAINKQGVVVFRARSRGGEGVRPGPGRTGARHLHAQPGRAGAAVHGVPAQWHGAAAEQHDDRKGRPACNASTSSRRCRASTPVPTRSRRAGSRRRCGPTSWTDGTETRTGTSGIYTSSSHGMPTTGASMLGDVSSRAVIQTFPHFQVPVHGAVPAGTGFDQFPGSPAVTERNTIVFKGNFAVGGVGKTGVFYRDIAAKGGTAPIELIASSYTKIPGSDDPVRFDRAAERRRQIRGIRRVRQRAEPHQGRHLPRAPRQQADRARDRGEDRRPGAGSGRRTKFERFGEAISVSSNGRHVLFWGWLGRQARRAAWSARTKVTPPCEAACAAGRRGTKGKCRSPRASSCATCRAERRPSSPGPATYVDGRRSKTSSTGTSPGRVRRQGRRGRAKTSRRPWNGPLAVDVLRRGLRQRRAQHVGDQGALRRQRRRLENEHALLLRDVKPSGIGDLVPMLRTGDLGVDMWTPRRRPAR